MHKFLHLLRMLAWLSRQRKGVCMIGTGAHTGAAFFLGSLVLYCFAQKGVPARCKMYQSTDPATGGLIQQLVDVVL